MRFLKLFTRLSALEQQARRIYLQQRNKRGWHISPRTTRRSLVRFQQLLLDLCQLVHLQSPRRFIVAWGLLLPSSLLLRRRSGRKEHSLVRRCLMLIRMGSRGWKRRREEMMNCQARLLPALGKAKHLHCFLSLPQRINLPSRLSISRTRLSGRQAAVLQCLLSHKHQHRPHRHFQRRSRLPLHPHQRQHQLLRRPRKQRWRRSKKRKRNALCLLPRRAIMRP